MKIVLTGGPSAGKTVIAETVLRQFRDQVVIVPESASILFKGGFPRGVTPEHVAYQQKAIYHTQSALEGIAQAENPNKLIICDRGTLDGLAYWPKSHDDFFKTMGTTLQDEIKRYDFVFHLETASGYQFDHSNPYRTESPALAHEIDEKIKTIWATHSKRIIIKNNCLFSDKVAHVLDFIKELLSGESTNVITKFNR